MRLIFLADVVPLELQRIVEFLNSQMTKTEVLAIEVRQVLIEIRIIAGKVSAKQRRVRGEDRGDRQTKMRDARMRGSQEANIHCHYPESGTAAMEIRKLRTKRWRGDAITIDELKTAEPVDILDRILTLPEVSRMRGA